MSDDRRDDRYARLYYRFEVEFPDVYADDRLFAWWCRLLLLADASWPMKAPLPRSVPRRVVAVLRDHSLVALDGDRYEVRGMAQERLRRTGNARRAADKRWDAHRESARNATASAPAYAPAMPSKAEQSKAEQSSLSAREGLTHITDAVAKAWTDATGKHPIASGAFAQELLDDLVMRNGGPAVVMAIETERAGLDRIPSPQQLAAAIRNRLEPLPDVRTARLSANDQREKERSRRAVEATQRRIHDYGGHADSPHPQCPNCRDQSAA